MRQALAKWGREEAELEILRISAARAFEDAKKIEEVARRELNRVTEAQRNGKKKASHTGDLARVASALLSASKLRERGVGFIQQARKQIERQRALEDRL